MKYVIIGLKIVAVPVAYALFLRLVFDIDKWDELFSVMTTSFLCCVPFAIGAITILLSPKEQREDLTYSILMPWLPIVAFVIITIFFSVEGWACWVMALPLFFGAASIGGLVARYYLRKKKNKNIYSSVIVLLPLILSPIENWIGAHQQTYTAYTYIDIHATADKIWRNVTRVKAIPETQDKGWLTNFLGFPRPIQAELNYEGVGAYRKAIFTNGLVFHETVSAYEHQKKMVFSIKAYPHEIPSTTMDKHVVIGGKFFDVLNGTYELEKLNEDTYRLHLYSHFTLNTTFNFYAGWWAKWIMKDIQNNILQVEKSRAER
jgi:hypothetical protein